MTLQHKLDRINYKTNRWLVCTDLKVVCYIDRAPTGQHKVLHIKLELSKQFVKALNKNSPVFNFLQETFQSLSNAKIEVVFIKLQI